MIRKKIESFSIDELGMLLRGVSNTSHAVSDFEVFFWHIMALSCFSSVGRNVRKFGHARRLGNFTREITPNDKYLSQFLPDRKVLWMTFEPLFEIFIKLPMFDCSRATCVLFWRGNQLLVPSLWGKARKISKYSKESFPRSHRIDQSAGKRSQKVILIMCPRIFLETLISCWICISKCHSTGKSIGHQPSTFATFVSLLLLYPASDTWVQS